jgi:hypothetical protein
MVAAARGSTEARGPGAEPGRERGASHLPHPHGGGEEPARGGEGQSQVILYASFCLLCLTMLPSWFLAYFHFFFFPIFLPACALSLVFFLEKTAAFIFIRAFFIDLILYTAEA